jgi:hypothetical protein
MFRTGPSRILHKLGLNPQFIAADLERPSQRSTGNAVHNGSADGMSECPNESNGRPTPASKHRWVSMNSWSSFWPASLPH